MLPAEIVRCAGTDPAKLLRLLDEHVRKKPSRLYCAHLVRAAAQSDLVALAIMATQSRGRPEDTVRDMRALLASMAAMVPSAGSSDL